MHNVVYFALFYRSEVFKSDRSKNARKVVWSDQKLVKVGRMLKRKEIFLKFGYSVYVVLLWKLSSHFTN